MFSEKLNKAIFFKKTPLCVGLDPRLEWLPNSIKTKAVAKYGKTFKAAAHAIFEFNRQIIDIISPHVSVVKLQSAFYEQYGHNGLQAFKESINYAKRQDLLVIADVKRSDIAVTAQAYADSFLGKVDIFGEKRFCYDVDAMTVNPFLGVDSLDPFINNCQKYGKGIFVLVKTSNTGNADIQNLKINDQTISEKVADMVNLLSRQLPKDNYGYSSVGAVVGATFPKEAEYLRRLMPQSIFLVPGYGAQGGKMTDLKYFFNTNRLGAVINLSRGIIFTYRDKTNGDKKYLDYIAKAILEVKTTINHVLSQI